MNFRLTMKCLTLVGLMSSASLFASNNANFKAIESDSVAPLSITGQVDAYFKASSNKLSSAKTSYTSQSGFGLGMANLVLAKDNGKIGFVADVMFGPRAEETNYNYTGSPAFIKQLFVTYKPSDKVKFTLGNFMTFVGYELVEAANNLNYTLSYNYTNGPFFHTGLKADFALTEKLGAMVGVFSVTDTKGKYGLINPALDVNKKYVGGQLSYVSGPFKVYLNGLSGKNPDSSKTTTFDITTSLQATEKFGIGLNIINVSETKDKAADKAFTGGAVYLNYAFAPSFTLAARGEMFKDADGWKYGASDNTITAFTISGNIKIDAFTIVPEIRIDSAKKNIWVNDKGAAKGGETAFILAGIYKF